MRIRWIFTLLVLSMVPDVVSGQQADLLTGLITSGDGRPLPGARVEAVSLETELTRSVVTGMDGRYLLLFPDGGGLYVLRVSYLGMTEELRPVIREGVEDLLVANFTLYPHPIALEQILVQVERLGQAGATGAESVVLTQDLLNRLPLMDLEPETLALLAAGVVGMEADSLTGRMRFSVAGMREELNLVTLDGVGLWESAMGIPDEGIRRVEVTTNTFDASRGGFAGGEVAVTTARGTNRASGTFTMDLDNSALQLRAVPTANANARLNVGGSWGGPVRDGLFYNVSFQVSRNASHRFALAGDDPLAAERSGVAPDSIARFLEILEGTHGVPISGQTGPYTQLTEDLRLQARIDWNIVEGDQNSHTLSARINTNLNNQDSTRISTLDLLQHGGEAGRKSRQATLNLTSQFTRNVSNVLSLSFQDESSDALPFIEIPEGQVRVTSNFEDGTRSSRTLVFGGNRNMPTDSDSRDYGLSNELSITRTVGSQIHRLKIGGSIDRSTSTDRSTANIFGTFRFSSLRDFEENRPYRYERSLSERMTDSGRRSAGFFLSDTWRVSEPLEVTLGLRWDFSRLEERPEYNPLLEEAFGRRNDVIPSASVWSPRLGVSYTLPGERGQRRSLTGGIGYFAGRAPLNIFSAAVRQTGLPNAEQNLFCIEDFVPFPDWDLYWGSSGQVPEACADGEVAGSPRSSRAPTVTMIQANQAFPSSLRMEFGYRTPLPLGLNGNFRYQYSMGRGLWGYRDLNLNPGTSTRMGADDRIFFGDMTTISQRTGAVSMVTSRLDPQFGQVYDVSSALKSTSHQFTAQVSGTLPPRIRTNLTYTLGFSRDQGSGSLQQVTTAGDPNEVEWGTANNDRRHNFNISLTYPLFESLELTMNSRLQSGTPFTPLVNRDINGDGLRNDRAYVFNPADPNHAQQAEAMGRLLAAVPDRVSDCLSSQFGAIAARNSCRAGWTQSLNMRANFRPMLPNLQRRVTFSADIRNVLTGFDYLLHGRDGMRGWGEGQRPDANLLEVNGFDPVAQAFRYEINEGFGQDNRGPEAFRNAFTVSLSLRINLGGNPAQQARGFIGGGGGGGGGGRGGGTPGVTPGVTPPSTSPVGTFQLASLAALVQAQGENRDDEAIVSVLLANPVARVLNIPAIGLSENQETILKSLSDSLGAALASYRLPLLVGVGSVASLMVESGAGPLLLGDNDSEIERLFDLEVRPLVDEARSEISDAMRELREAVAVEQWERLPQEIRVLGPGEDPLPSLALTQSLSGLQILDRMLANPLAVMLDLHEVIELDEVQVQALGLVSDRLQERLIERRELLGRRLENVPVEELLDAFREIFPGIEEGREEIRSALRSAEALMTAEQWGRIPAVVRDPFAPQRPPSEP